MTRKYPEPRINGLGYMNFAAAAEFLGISQNTLRKYAAYRLIPHVKIGRLTFFDPKELEAWVENRRVVPVGEGRGR